MQPLTKAGVVIGLGLGGFFDGIVFHQILGWHHLVCTTETCQPATIEALKLQNTQDGYFHLGVWLMTLVGVALLFRAMRGAPLRRGAALAGPMLAGWGLFNLVEGLIDHQLLGLHHVRPGHPHEFWWDLGFLASGAALVMIGGAVTRVGRPDPQATAVLPGRTR
ncbi:MAG: DUF2243 domain-containing protein [Opitutus sp.]|nr:DUF2243 domain-containing protein [Opitutus sp.]